jgi:hypothetical protein
MFASRGDRVCAQDLYAFRALKALLLDHGYDEAHVLRLLEEEGAQAVIAAYSARHVRPQTNPAHALQHAVRSAAAAGFFGEVYAEVDDDTPADLTGARPASYAQARLARLK